MNKATNPRTMYKIRLKKGDNVIVRTGKDKGKTGVIEAVHPFTNKVTVKGINVVKRHRKPSRSNPQGTIEEITKPIWVSKVSLIDPMSKKATRIGYDIKREGTKVRISKKSGKEIK